MFRWWFKLTHRHCYGRPRWHSDLAFFGRRCRCGAIKPHPWFWEG